MNTSRYTKEQNPWFSFKPYEETNADSFKGRSEDIAEMMKLISRYDLTVCYAKSGIGKSSLINAGLKPRLRRKQLLPIPIRFKEDFFDGTDCEQKIKEQIKYEIAQLNDAAKGMEFYSIEELHPSLSASPLIQAIDKELRETSLWWLFHTRQIHCRRGDFDIYFKPILIFDQFEEVFYKAQTEEKKHTFFSRIQDISSSRPSEETMEVIERMQSLSSGENVTFPEDCGLKLLFSLREDSVGMLDYWAVQRISIPGMKDNRFCLMPLTKEQASEVILQQNIDGQRVDLLDDYEQTIIESLIESDGIPAVLLSVLCNRIFNEEVTGNTKTTKFLNHFTESAGEISPNTNSNLRAFIQELVLRVYEERVRESKVPRWRVLKIEQALVRDNGQRKRAELSDFSESLQKVCYKLADAYLLRIDDFGEKNGQKVQTVEIIHDRVAEVIAERRHRIDKKNQLLWSRIALLLGFLAIFAFTYLYQLRPAKTEKETQNFPYMRLENDEVEDYSSRKLGTFKNCWKLQNLICDYSSNFIYNCPSLQTISITSSYLWLDVSDCDELREILLNNNVKELRLSIRNCLKLAYISLPQSLESFSINTSSEKITFRTEQGCRYIWDNGILWDSKADTIIYARYDAPENPSVPYVTSKRNYVYRPRTFTTKGSVNQEVALPYLTIRDEVWVKDTLRFPHSIKQLDLTTYNITNIPDSAFKNCTSLRKVKLPSSIKEIGECAFQNCISLQEVLFQPDTKLNIGEMAFANCQSLTEVRFPRYNLGIGFCAFQGCSKLRLVELPDSYEKGRVFINAFSQCPVIKFIYNPDKYIQSEDGTVIYSLDKSIIWVNGVEGPHTYSDSVHYVSKKGVLVNIYGSEKRIFNIPTQIAGKQSVIKQAGVPFFNNIGNPETLTIPISLRNINWSGDIMLFETPTNLRELHVPSHEEKWANIVPDSLRHNVTIYVPYGTLKYISDDSNFKDYLSVKEESLWNWVWAIFRHHFETSINVINLEYQNFWWYCIAFVLIVAFVLSYITYYRKRKTKDYLSKQDITLIIVKTLAAVVLGPIFWYIIYWFLFIDIGTWLGLDYSIFAIQIIYDIVFFFIAIIISVMAVYLVLYSDDFSLRGLWSGTKNNYIATKQILSNIRNHFTQHPKDFVKTICLMSGIIVIALGISKWNKYKESLRLEAVRQVEGAINVADKISESSGTEALNLLSKAWKENRKLIKGEPIERTLSENTYNLLLKQGHLDTCLIKGLSYTENLSQSPDGQSLLFNTGYKDYSCLLSLENGDTIHLGYGNIENLYKFSHEGSVCAYDSYKNNLIMIDIKSLHRDTLTSFGAFDFCPDEDVLAYVGKYKQVRFYNYSTHKEEESKSIILDKYNSISNILYVKGKNRVFTIHPDMVLSHNRGTLTWNEPDTLINKGFSISTIMGGSHLAAFSNDTLFSWPLEHIGKKKYEKFWVCYGMVLPTHAFSTDGKRAILLNNNNYQKQIRVLNLSESEEDIQTITIPFYNRDICLANDGKSLFISTGEEIHRIQILTKDEIYRYLIDNFKEP